MKLLNNIADFFNRHWIWKIIISFFPSLWLPVIVKYLGIGLGIIDGNQALTIRGWVATIIIYVLAFSVLLVSGYSSKLEEARKTQLKSELEKHKATNEYYDKVIACVHSSHQQKSDLLLQATKTYKDSHQLPYTTLVDPIQQLKNLASEIQECFSGLTKIPKDRLVVSMAYQLDGSTPSGHNWKWVDSHVTQGGLTLETLTQNNQAAFYRLIHGSSPMLYINNKAIALQKQQYISDAKDGRFKNVGSLICWKIQSQLSTNDILGKLVVSISSYGNQFAKDVEADIAAVEESVDVIYRLFEEQIVTELTCLYLLDSTQT